MLRFLLEIGRIGPNQTIKAADKYFEFCTFCLNCQNIIKRSELNASRAISASLSHASPWLALFLGLPWSAGLAVL